MEQGILPWREGEQAAYRALQAAAERIATRDYNVAFRAHVKAGRVESTFRPGAVSEAHETVLQTIRDMMAERITVEQAMAILHDYGILCARTGPDTHKLHTFYALKYLHA